MVTLSEPLLASAVRDMRWIRVDDVSAIGACRNAAAAMAAGLGFPAARADQLALAVTEAASNLHKHAVDGAMLVRVGRAVGRRRHRDDHAGRRPGLRDVRAAMRDGHSTAGTLGIGLGAIRRLADTCDVLLRDEPEHRGRGSLPGRSHGRSRSTCAGLTRPITGETDCGDAFAAVQAGDVLTGVLVRRARARSAGRRSGRRGGARGAGDAGPRAGRPGQARARAAVRGTRGGAVAVVQVTGSAVRFAGLGNVAAWIIAGRGRSGLVSVPGIAGHQARSIRTFEYQLPAGAAIVLHSDGLTQPVGHPRAARTGTPATRS